MSELKDRWFWAYPTESVDCDGITGSAHEVYSKSDVDEAIAELKAEIERLTIDKRNAELRADVADGTVEKLKAENAELKQKLQDQCISCPVKMQEDDVVAEKDNEIRRLKRALWLAHAYKAKFKRWWLYLALDCEASAIHPDTKTLNRIRGKIRNCEKSERKCRDKAEANK